MKILLVAYYYPPPEGAGGLRPRRMAVSLREAGHDVTVLTHTHGRGTMDKETIRVHDPSFNGFRNGFRGLVWGARRMGVEALNSLGVSRSIFSSWERRALAAGLKWADENPPDLVMATYPPVESLSVGLDLARKTGSPLVADFRDGLNFEPVERVQPWRFPGIRGKHEVLEERILTAAAGILAAHPKLAEYLRSRGGTAPVLWLPNGFDPLPQPSPRPALMGNGVHLVHTGRFGLSDSGCDPAPLAEAMWRKAGVGFPLVLHLMGKLSRREARLFRPLERRGMAVIHGEVDRAEGLSWQQHAHGLLLVVSPERPSVIPGKLFEYLPAAAPILALAPDGTAADLVRESGRGWVADPRDLPAIQDMLQRLTHREDGDLHRDNDRISTYCADHQMGILETWLKGITGSGGNGLRGGEPTQPAGSGIRRYRE